MADQIVSTHRVLIFAQLKSMLDIVESDLLRKDMPNVTYLRLDGSVCVFFRDLTTYFFVVSPAALPHKVPASQRHGLVAKFNSDPTIDLLLLTTHVGGLGLNLTGADTVIFLEHDWNPMKDLQVRIASTLPPFFTYQHLLSSSTRLWIEPTE